MNGLLPFKQQKQQNCGMKKQKTPLNVATAWYAHILVFQRSSGSCLKFTSTWLCFFFVKKCIFFAFKKMLKFNLCLICFSLIVIRSEGVQCFYVYNSNLKLLMKSTRVGNTYFRFPWCFVELRWLVYCLPIPKHFVNRILWMQYKLRARVNNSL